MKTLLIACAAVSGASCGEKGNLEVESNVAVAAGATQSPSGLELGGGILVVDRARVEVSEIEFEGGKEEDGLEAELGAAVIDLALDGTPTAVTSDAVDAGQYHTVGLELKVGDVGGSIVVEGTYDGDAFTYYSEIVPEAEFAIDPPVTVPANGSASVGVTFDVAAWFTAGDSSILDPTDAANREAIEAAILASMAAHATIEEEDGDAD